MLRICGLESPGHEAVNFDEYVPFTAEFSVESFGPSLYWRNTDGNKFLFEIGINRKTGAIKEMTLTLVHDEMIVISNHHEPTVSEKKMGLPVCHTMPWLTNDNKDTLGNYKRDFIDECETFKLFLGEDWLCLRFDYNEQVVSVFYVDRVSFGITNDGFLKEIRISNISPREMSLLTKAVGKKII